MTRASPSWHSLHAPPPIRPSKDSELPNNKSPEAQGKGETSRTPNRGEDARQPSAFPSAAGEGGGGRRNVHGASYLRQPSVSSLDLRRRTPPSLARRRARSARGKQGFVHLFFVIFRLCFGLVFFGSVSRRFPMLFTKIFNGIGKNLDSMKVSEEPKHFGKGGARRNAGASQPCGHPYP